RDRPSVCGLRIGTAGGVEAAGGAVCGLRAVAAELAAGRGAGRAAGGLAGPEGATLFMVLLSAYQLLLSRWSGQEDIVVGSPIANRTHAETEGVIGFFVNTLALRAEVRGGESFLTLLSQMRERTLGA